MALQGRFGVEVRTRFTPASWVAPDLPRASASPRLTETAMAFGLTGADLDAEIVSVRAKRSELAAYEAGLVERKATLGARHPLPMLPGARDEAGGAVDDFLPDEVAVLLRCSVPSARYLVEHALVLVRQLPVVWHALADGRIDESRARVVCEVLRWQAASVGGPFADADIEALAARAVGWAERGCPATTLRERLQAGLVAADPEAADRRREQRVRAGDVTTAPTGDGTAELRAAGVEANRAALMRAQLTAYAKKLKADGDTRPLGALRIAVMDALITRPWEHPDPAVAHVTITAELLDLIDPDQVAALRDLVTSDPDDDLSHDDGAHGVLAPHHGTGSTGGGDSPARSSREQGRTAPGHQAPERPTLDPTVQDTPAQDRSAVRVRGRGALPREVHAHHADAGAPAAQEGPGRDAVADVAGLPVTPAAVRALLRRIDVLGLVDPTKGDLRLTLTDRGRTLAVASPAELLAATRTGTGPPPATTAYTPTAAQYRYLRARDRHCRFPGCRRTAQACDADHVVPHREGGPTCIRNLALLCRHHHRLKTHAPGWAFRLDPDGTLHVTTPGGATLTTRPPGVDQVLDLQRPPPPPHDPVADPAPF